MTLRSEYDSWHTRYHDADPTYDDTSSPWYQWVAQSVGCVAGLHTLEVACGRGGFVAKLGQSAAFACGVDFSFTALSIAQQRLQTGGGKFPIGLVQGDAQMLPFRDNVFDVVVSCETIEHLPSPSHAIREFHRVTRPGGSLYLTTPNYFNFMGLYEIYAHVRHPQRIPDQPYDRIQLFFQTRQLLKRAGWKILRSDGVVHQFPYFPGRNPARIRGLESYSVIRKLLSIFALTYCLVAKKSQRS